MMHKSIVLALAILLWATALCAQQVSVQEYVLPNGLRLLMIPKKGDPNVAAGWIAKVGSVNEHSGITGLSHLFEHMMFKGTHTIGTTDIVKDLQLMARMDSVKAEIQKEEQDQLRRLRLGLISNLEDPRNRSPRHNELLQDLARIEKEEKEFIVKNEFDQIYTSAGASGENAETSEDYTLYFINVPSNKLELWFWMESDRLLSPVFREFYSERDVVHEERTMSAPASLGILIRPRRRNSPIAISAGSNRILRASRRCVPAKSSRWPKSEWWRLQKPILRSKSVSIR